MDNPESLADALKQTIDMFRVVNSQIRALVALLPQDAQSEWARIHEGYSKAKGFDSVTGAPRREGKQ